MRTPSRPRPSARWGAALAVAALVLTSGCTDSLSDQARSTDEPTSGAVGSSAFESTTCEAVRDGIDSYNAGDLEESVRAFDAALPLAEDRAAQAGSSEDAPDARALLEAVRYYAGLSTDELADAFPASPETLTYQQTTLDQCQPFGTAPEDPSEQSA